MATLAPNVRSVVDRERSFFLYLAIAMAAIIVAGFSLNIAAGRSSFSVPLVYHVHAFVFFGWVVLYLVQTILAATGNVRLHRQLGWLALAFIPAMVVLGTLMTVTTLQRSGGPFFFDQNQFLIANPLGITAFAGLAIAGLVMRRRTDWHRRLMCCAMIILTGPGFGRLLPMPLMVPYGWYVAAIVAPMAFFAAGMIADRRRSGRVHPAWYCGLAVLVGTQLVADGIAYSPAGHALTEQVLAGTPGAGRPMAGQMSPAPLRP